MQELVERAAHVVGERLAVDEAASAIERKRRLEGISAAGLQAELLDPSPARFGDDVLEQESGDPATEIVGVRAHRFQLAMIGTEHLQRTDSGDAFALPYRPDRHLGSLQAGEVEREDAARWRRCVHACEMQ